MTFVHGAGCRCDLQNVHIIDCHGQRLLTVRKPESSLLQRNCRDESQDGCFVDPYEDKNA